MQIWLTREIEEKMDEISLEISTLEKANFRGYIEDWEFEENQKNIENLKKLKSGFFLIFREIGKFEKEIQEKIDRLYQEIW